MSGFGMWAITHMLGRSGSGEGSPRTSGTLGGRSAELPGVGSDSFCANSMSRKVTGLGLEAEKL